MVEGSGFESPADDAHESSRNAEEQAGSSLGAASSVGVESAQNRPSVSRANAIGTNGDDSGERVIADLVGAIAKAASAGRFDLVDRLEARLAAVQGAAEPEAPVAPVIELASRRRG